MLVFTGARHRALSENIANADTPGYRPLQFDPRGFQAALRRAFENRRPSEPFRLPGTRQLREDTQGRLQVKPQREPAENLLFHDGTNGRIERQMSALAENAVAHQLAVELLRSRFDGLMRAIRGRVG
jgi:flagellar basal-body rod protein FlgB